MTESILPRRALLGAAGALLAAPILTQAQAQAQAQTQNQAQTGQPVPYSTGTAAAKLQAPAFATDCHFHIYNDKYPPVPGGLPAPNALPADYRKLQARIGTTRGVIVQPSLYGTNNEPTLQGMAELGANFRAVAVVIDTVEDAELRRLHAAGVRGIRFNLVQAGTTTQAMLEPLSRRIAAMGWHVQLHMLGDQIAEAADLLQRLPSRVVFDHRGRLPQPAGANHPAFAVIRRMLDKGNTWVKLSAAYMESPGGPPAYPESSAVAKAFFAANPQRMVWGSDWPHPTEKPDNKPDDAVLFDLLGSWIPDAAARNRVLVDNPAELYDFPRS